MGKPWARYEVGFINHDKFRALTGNAIALWLEGKNYADEKYTDGLLPLGTVKTFRFYGKKSVALLTTSCGENPGAGQPYAPLWEPHPVGFKMHGYLEHNDCREEVLQRLQDKAQVQQLRKATNAERQRKFREDRREQIDALLAASQANVTPVVTQDVTPPAALRNVLRNAPQAVTRNASNAVTSTPSEAEAPSPSPSEEKKERKASPSPPAVYDPFTDEALTMRAGDFIRRYQALYPEHRWGALYTGNQFRDYDAAVTLCRTYTDDARLDRLATCFLTTEHSFAAEGSRTIPQFRALVGWLDGELSKWEKEHPNG